MFALLLQNCLLKHFPEERSFISNAGPAAMKMPVSASASPRPLLSLWLCILRLHRSLRRMHKGEHSNYTVPFGCYLKYKVLIYFSVQFSCSVMSNVHVFSNETTLRMRWPKYWSFSFSIIPSKEIPGLISFRMDWLDLLAVQGTLKSLLHHHISKASILRPSEGQIEI